MNSTNHNSIYTVLKTYQDASVILSKHNVQCAVGSGDVPANSKALGECRLTDVKMALWPAFIYSFIPQYLLNAYDGSCSVLSAGNASRIHWL